MNLTETFEIVSKSVVALVSRLRQGPIGQEPVLPAILGTGFAVHEDGIIATNAHVVKALSQIPNHPKTGRPGIAAMFLLPESKEKGTFRQMALMVDLKRLVVLGEFSTTHEWYGRNVPDLAFVQLAVREVPCLPLATEEFYLKTGMEIATVGYPLGDSALTALGKLNQATPFLRRGIVSSVFPFAVPKPHGFSIDIMQQGGSSGSPIFRPHEPIVVGMMSSSVLDWANIASERLTLRVALTTNISIAEPAVHIKGALDDHLKREPLDLAGIPTLEEHIKQTAGSTSPDWEQL